MYPMRVEYIFVMSIYTCISVDFEGRMGLAVTYYVANMECGGLRGIMDHKWDFYRSYEIIAKAFLRPCLGSRLSGKVRFHGIHIKVKCESH